MPELLENFFSLKYETYITQKLKYIAPSSLEYNFNILLLKKKKKKKKKHTHKTDILNQCKTQHKK